MNILLVCASGLSTRMLANTIQNAAAILDVKLNIVVCGVNELVNHTRNADIVLLAPQIGYHLNKIQEVYKEIPVKVIDKMDYGLQDGSQIIKAALNAINEYLEEEK